MRIASAALLLFLSGCASVPPMASVPMASERVPAVTSAALPSPTSWVPDVSPPAQAHFAVYPPYDGWVVPQELSLEVGEEAWSIETTGRYGVTTPMLSEITRVRLFGVDDCHLYAAFDAAPGGAYVIRFAEDASTSIEQYDGIEDGPGLVERDLTGCG
jgi:hypothetical protein